MKSRTEDYDFRWKYAIGEDELLRPEDSIFIQMSLVIKRRDQKIGEI